MNARLPRTASPIALVLALAASGCGGGADDATGAAASGGSDAGVAATPLRDVNPRDPATLRAGGTLRLTLPDFAENWNPMHVDGNDHGYELVRQSMLPRLFDFDERGTATPNPDFLLSVEELSEDPTIVRLRLNPDAVWGDGSPVDGDDVRAVWRACNGERPEFNCVSTQPYESIASIETGEDARDVTITYATAFPDWSQGFTGVLKAESIADAETFNEGWKALDDDRLSGPFTLGSFDEVQKVMTLVPNERWWGEKPRLDSIVWRAIAPDARAQAFANAEIDAFDIGPDPDAYQRALRVEAGEVRKAGGPDFRHFTFNSTAGALQEPVVRRAIVHALDRESIGASDLAGIDWPASPLNNHVFLQGQEGYVDTAAATGLDFDPDAARALLDEAGWTPGADGVREKDGRRLAVRFTQLAGVRPSENEALQARDQLADVGIELEIVTVPTARFVPTLTAGEFELIAFSWIGTPYPFGSIEQLYGTGSDSNFAQLSMPAVDELIDRIAVETDRVARIELANEADAIIWENVHTLPLYQRPQLFAVRKDLANYGATGLSTLHWEHVGYEIE